MSTHDQKPAIPFRAPAGIPVLGQPFSITSLYCPINVTLTCNCAAKQGGMDTTVTILGSVSAACPGCGRTYNMALVTDPTTGSLSKLEMRVGLPPGDQVPS